MSTKNEPEKIRTTVIVSPENSMSGKDWKGWAFNLLIFAAPTLSVFFGQLALGVHWKIAAPIALLAFWQTAADFFKKYTSRSIHPAEGSDVTQ